MIVGLGSGPAERDYQSSDSVCYLSTIFSRDDAHGLSEGPCATAAAQCRYEVRGASGEGGVGLCCDHHVAVML